MRPCENRSARGRLAGELCPQSIDPGRSEPLNTALETFRCWSCHGSLVRTCELCQHFGNLVLPWSMFQRHSRDRRHRSRRRRLLRLVRSGLGGLRVAQRANNKLALTTDPVPREGDALAFVGALDGCSVITKGKQ